MGMALFRRSSLIFNDFGPIGVRMGTKKSFSPHCPPDFMALTISGEESADAPSPNGDSWGSRGTQHTHGFAIETQHFTSFAPPLA
jgi:hypothetical protein